MRPLYQNYPNSIMAGAPRWSLTECDDGFGNLIKLYLEPGDEVHHFLMGQTHDSVTHSDVAKEVEKLKHAQA